LNFQPLDKFLVIAEIFYFGFPRNREVCHPGWRFELQGLPGLKNRTASP
jgi:hypothetical protein